MVEVIQEFLDDFTRSFGLRDLLDVAFLSAVLFFVLGWLRQQLSRNMLVAASLFVALYVLTRLFRLYMVELVFRGLFIFILLAVVVVFQSDIRRFVEKIGLWISRGTMRIQQDARTVDTIVEAVEGMAESRTGALIAVRGREEWERLIDGGIEHGGKISQQLLYSLFNPSSPSHDGAVMMEGSRLVKFGTHLPLSRNLDEVGEHGTRHTAALGLAEACDALVIVVSEEQGSISVAHNGRLVHMDSASHLKRRLETFWKEHYEQRSTPSISWWSRRRLRTATLAVGMALLAWFLFVFDPGMVYRTLTAPVEMRNLPANWALNEPSPSEVRVTVSGPQAAFQLLDRSGLAVSLDLSDVEDGTNEFVVDEETIPLPPGMDLYDIEPRTVAIQAQRLLETRLPVKVVTKGSLPDTLELVGFASDPDSMTVLAPDGTSQSVTTDSIDLSGVASTTTFSSGVSLPERARLPEGASRDVAVRIHTRRRE